MLPFASCPALRRLYWQLPNQSHANQKLVCGGGMRTRGTSRDAARGCGNPPRARNPWQCQLWVARTLGMPGIPGSARNGWREPAACQETLAVPELGGGDPRDARNPWQCQKWLAGTCPAPIIPGSARAGWRAPAACQKTLAVPTLGGEGPRDARNPWQCQKWLAETRPAPETPGSANPGWKAVTRVQAMWGIVCVRFPTRKRARRRAGS